MSKSAYFIDKKDKSKDFNYGIYCNSVTDILHNICDINGCIFTQIFKTMNLLWKEEKYGNI